MNSISVLRPFRPVPKQYGSYGLKTIKPIWIRRARERAERNKLRRDPAVYTRTEIILSETRILFLFLFRCLFRSGRLQYSFFICAEDRIIRKFVKRFALIETVSPARFPSDGLQKEREKNARTDGIIDFRVKSIKHVAIPADLRVLEIALRAYTITRCRFRARRRPAGE